MIISIRVKVFRKLRKLCYVYESTVTLFYENFKFFMSKYLGLDHYW